MPSWIGRLKGAAGLDLPRGVSQDWVRRLDEVLQPAGASAGDLRRYVLHGEPRSVLHRTQGQLAAAVGLVGFKPEAALNVYKGFEGVPVDVRLRWALLLEAGAGTTYPYYLPVPGGVHWPEILMVHAGGYASYGNSQKIAGLSARGLEEMLVEAGLEAHAVLVASFAAPVSTGYITASRQRLVSALAEYPESLDRHAAQLKPVVGTGDLAQRLHVLDLLDRAHPAALTVLAEELAEMAVSGSKQVRVKAHRLLEKVPGAAIDPLKEHASDGKPDQRAHALSLLYSLGEEQFARSAASGDKSASVRDLLNEWESAPGHTLRAWRGLRVPVARHRLENRADARLEQAAGRSVHRAERRGGPAKRWSKANAKRYAWSRAKPIEPISDADVRKLKHYLASERPGGTQKAADAGAGILLDFKRRRSGSHPDITPAPPCSRSSTSLGWPAGGVFRGLNETLARALNVFTKKPAAPPCSSSTRCCAGRCRAGGALL